jgi:hypothetical protein
MRVIIALYILVIGASCAPMFDKELDSEWELFKHVHQKQYKTIDEENIRYVIKDFL